MEMLYASYAILDYHTVLPNKPVVFLLFRGQLRVGIFLAFPGFFER